MARTTKKKSQSVKTAKTVGKYGAAGLIGAAVGATLGVLFAPASGKTTRKNIATGTKKAANKVSHTVVKGEKAVVKGVKKVSRKVEREIGQAKKKIRRKK